MDEEKLADLERRVTLMSEGIIKYIGEAYGEESMSTVLSALVSIAVSISPEATQQMVEAAILAGREEDMRVLN